MSGWCGEVRLEPWMVSALDLTGSRLLVFGAIWTGCRACGGEVAASLSQISAATGLCRQTVRSSLADLRGAGLLDLAGSAGPRGRRSWRIGPTVERMVAARSSAAGREGGAWLWERR